MMPHQSLTPRANALLERIRPLEEKNDTDAIRREIEAERQASRLEGDRVAEFQLTKLLILTLYHARRYEEALAEAIAAQHIDEEGWSSLSSISVALTFLGRDDEAIATLLRELDNALLPAEERHMVFVALGHLFVKKNNLAMANQYLRSAFSVAIENELVPETWDYTLAAKLGRKGDVFAEQYLRTLLPMAKRSQADGNELLTEALEEALAAMQSGDR